MTAQPAREARPRHPSGASPDDFARELATTLVETPRRISSVYLYDSVGSALFEAITRLPWYTIGRAETGLLRRHATDVFAGAGPAAEIIEFGGGTGGRVLTLVLAGRRPPGLLDVHLVDVSAAALADATHVLGRLDGVRVVTHETTYERALEHFSRGRHHGRRRLVLLLGAIVGNQSPAAAAHLLARVRGMLDPGEAVLMGVDLIKSERQMLAAYDDPLGVSAAFNRNVLVRINRELQAQIELGDFAHRAVWNGAMGCVERQLVSRQALWLRIPAAGIDTMLREDEPIVTERSHKYELSGVAELLMRARFRRRAQWIDQEHGYALTLAEAI